MGLEPEPGKGRSAGQQAGYQIIALVVTIAIAIVSGLLLGKARPVEYGTFEKETIEYSDYMITGFIQIVYKK